MKKLMLLIAVCFTALTIGTSLTSSSHVEKDVIEMENPLVDKFITIYNKHSEGKDVRLFTTEGIKTHLYGSYYIGPRSSVQVRIGQYDTCSSYKYSSKIGSYGDRWTTKYFIYNCDVNL